MLESAASGGALEVMEELLGHGIISSMDATHALYRFYSAATCAAGGAEFVYRLVEMRADVNAQTCDWCNRTALYRAIHSLLVLQHRFHRVTIFNTLMYHVKGATPLMLALLSGNDECAAALIATGAKLNLRNSRGLSAAELIRRRSGPKFLLEACEGRVEACQRVSRLACGWVEMHF